MMRGLALLVAAVLVAPGPAGAQTRGRSAAPARASVVQSGDVAARAIARVFPSLVRVSVVYLDQQAGREVKGLLSGSGTIISTDGYVVTNHHVAGRPRRIVCTLSDREEIPADLVGTDPMSDIAVIKLHPEKPRTFPAAVFGDSSKLRRGQIVLAMGSPLALSQSVTQGIVSNTEMIMPDTFGPAGGNRLNGEDVGAIVRWIGHDAAIYPGNSGGPLVNLDGEIVGINEISFGLAGAIPGNLARSIADTLIAHGHVTRSWIGLDIQPRIGDADLTGVLVSSVADRSPAQAAGLAAGDVLLSVNGTPLDVKYAEQLPPANQLLFGLPIGKPAAFVVRRGAGRLTLPVVPVERPAAESTPADVASWGMVAANMTDLEARDLGRETTDGVRVVSVKANGPADQARPALKPNDVIVDVEGHPIHHLSDLDDETRTALGTKARAKLLVTFERDRERLLTVVDAGELVPDTPPREARKAWVPVEVQVLTPPLADRLGLHGRTGVRVTRVLDAEAPLHVGDVILAVDGDPVRASSINDGDLFGAQIRRYRVGDSVTLTVNRSGTDTPVAVILGQTPSQPREMPQYDDAVFEFRARDLAEADREDPRLAGVTGVLVEAVAARGWASLGHLNGGDVILTIDGRAVRNVADLEARMKDIETRRPASIVFEVWRGIRTTFVEIQPAWK
jgi:serine protease Do